MMKIKASIKRKPKKKPKRILELKNTVTEIKISLEEFKGRFEGAKERINRLEDRTVEIMKSKEQKEKKIKEKQTEPKGSMGHHQEEQHTHCGRPREERKEWREYSKKQ